MIRQLLCISTLIMMVACTSTTQKSTPGDETSTAGTLAKGQSAVTDPLSAKNILQVALGSPDHTTLCAGVVATKMEDVLVNAGPLTVFAPTNAAFDKLPEGTLDDLLKTENLPTLARIIKYHAAPGSYHDGLLRDGMQLFVASGHNVKIGKKDGKITVNGANVLGTVKASNGLVHVIDQVLLPPD